MAWQQRAPASQGEQEMEGEGRRSTPAAVSRTMGAAATESEHGSSGAEGGLAAPGVAFSLGLSVCRHVLVSTGRLVSTNFYYSNVVFTFLLVSVSLLVPVVSY